MIIVNKDMRKVTKDGEEVKISKLAFNVFLYMASRKNSVMSRQDLLAACWEQDLITNRSVDIQIRNIRKALGDDVITTIAGVGYGVYAESVEVVGLNDRYKLVKGTEKTIEITGLYEDRRGNLITPLNFATYDGVPFVVSARIGGDSDWVVTPVDEFNDAYVQVHLDRDQ